MAEFVQSKMIVIKPDGAILVSPESLEAFWNELGDIPVDDDGIIQESFLWWPKGTDREDIWHWFDEKYPGGIKELNKAWKMSWFNPDQKECMEKLSKYTNSGYLVTKSEIQEANAKEQMNKTDSQK